MCKVEGFADHFLNWITQCTFCAHVTVGLSCDKIVNFLKRQENVRKHLFRCRGCA